MHKDGQYLPPRTSIEPLECGVGARTWKACMRMCVFLHEFFLQSAFFPPASPPTGSFFTLGFFTQSTFFFSLPYMRNIHESFLHSVSFPPATRQPVVFFTPGFFTQHEYKLTTK